MQLEDWSKIAWLLFMFSDMPRLIFRGGLVLKNLPKLFFQQEFGLSDLFSTAHRHENQSCGRIVFQALLQNLGYILCMMVFLVVFHAVFFAFLFVFVPVVDRGRLVVVGIWVYVMHSETPFDADADL